MDQSQTDVDFRLPVQYTQTYVQGLGAFLPGQPVSNDEIDSYIAPLNKQSARLKQRVLRDNGIEQRHYAIGPDGQTRYSAARLAAEAVNACLADASANIRNVSLLCTGTSGGDTIMPGFANMLQGELGAQPMETSSHQGVCASGVAALKHAASAVERGEHAQALVATTEVPSRMFKQSRFVPSGYDTDFDSHFLRWMLSDGAGAMLLGRQPSAGAVSLKLKWIHLRSFSGDFPVCMQLGQPGGGRTQSYLDYPSAAEAERDGALLLRQDIRLLPHLFDVGIHEYARLVKAGCIEPDRVDHFLCHYSSEKFRGVVSDLMDKAGLSIPQSRWYSNLKWRGNTGASSIFIMLADFMKERALVPGQQVLCFVPESGRFTVSFMMFEVVAGGEAPGSHAPDAVPPPQSAQPDHDPRLAGLLRELAETWHLFRSRMWRSRLIRRITTGELSLEDYRRWMSCWIPQVREGTIWMRRAVDNLDDRYDALRSLVSTHAGEEQFDYRVLFADYRAAGGVVAHIDGLKRNAGGEALNAYMHARAGQPNPVGLLGGIYIIEGTGQRIIPALLPFLRQQAGLADTQLSFLRYHSENDPHHLDRWLQSVRIALAVDGDQAAREIAETARAVAELYALQMESVL